MKRYKKKLDEIHAPQELIEKTIDKILVQDVNTDVSKPIFYRKALFSAIIIVAVIFVIGIVKFNSSSIDLIYNTVPDSFIKANDTQTKESISIAEYSDYLGISLDNLIKNATLVRSKISVEKNNNTIIYDYATLVYNLNEKPITVKLSKNNNVTSYSPANAQYSNINGHDVIVMISESGNEYAVSLKHRDIYMVLSGFNMTKSEFEKFLISFLLI